MFRRLLDLKLTRSDPRRFTKIKFSFNPVVVKSVVLTSSIQKKSDRNLYTRSTSSKKGRYCLQVLRVHSVCLKNSNQKLGRISGKGKVVTGVFNLPYVLQFHTPVGDMDVTSVVTLESVTTHSYFMELMPFTRL